MPRVLVAAHVAKGNELEALRTYDDDDSARIRQALGLGPSIDMEAMIGPVRAAAPV